MMFDRAYRQRLEADLAQWETDGVITPAVVAAIRGTLRPPAPGVTIAVVVAIVGGLLIAAAFLAFVAAHWAELARLLRVSMLLAGSLTAFGFGGWFAREDRPVPADLCASVGSIIFGAAIALIGQMYHLGEDFAGGMLLWALGALTAAALTGSRGALAVGLVAACAWSSARVFDARDPHFSFVVIWLLAAGLALAWNSRVAAHLVALATLPWWIAAAVQPGLDPAFVLADGAALLFGTGLVLAATPWQRMSSVGVVLSAYGAVSLAVAAIMEVVTANDFFHSHALAIGQPAWAIACGVAGAILAFMAAAMTRRAGPAFAGGATALALLAAATWTPPQAGEPWLAYVLELCAMLCLVVSGMLDAARSRIVAGWLGIAGVIAGITWAVKGSLLRRSAFLAVAGGAAVVLSTVLGRLLPRADLTKAFSSEVETGSRQENASNQESRAPFRFNRNGKGSGLFTSLAERFERIPKAALFGVAAVVQIVLLAVMITDRAQILRDGTEVKLQTRPVDPRDLLRGDYVVLGYDISQLSSGPLQNQPAGSRNPMVFVKLAPNPDGLYEAVSVHADAVAVATPEVLIRGRVAYGATCGPSASAFCDKLTIRYNLESYFVPEGEGRKLELARNQRKLTVVAAVLPSGRAAIKRLLVDGEPIYEEPWF